MTTSGTGSPRIQDERLLADGDWNLVAPIVDACGQDAIASLTVAAARVAAQWIVKGMDRSQ